MRNEDLPVIYQKPPPPGDVKKSIPTFAAQELWGGWLVFLRDTSSLRIPHSVNK